MNSEFQFDVTIPFDPENPPQALRGIPAGPGVLALYGARPEDQPYLTRTADLRRRAMRLLAPPEATADGATPLSKRLNLRERVARIAWSAAGSEFESTLMLYRATAGLFGLAEARRRLKLHTPYFLRFSGDNAYPRLYPSNRLSRRGLANTYGPFASRAAAERYCDAVLDLFKLRRCYEDLMPSPDHPGCVYQEMKKCLAPCNQAWKPEGAEVYSAEAAAVKRFLDSRGESMILDIGLERETASAAMEFERAAALHTQWQKVKAAQALADELVQPVPKLRAVIVQKALAPSAGAATAAQPSARQETARDAEQRLDEAAVFLLEGGCLLGPSRLSTLGVRAVKEQTSVGSSLFAQPLMLQAVPLVGAEGTQEATPAESPEARAAALMTMLEAEASPGGLLGEGISASGVALLSDHLSLLRRWYYRPEKQRAGEVFLPNGDGSWPLRRILRGAARMALGDPAPMAETQRELAERNPEDAVQRTGKTKVLHAGRPDVERHVPVIERPPVFTSRRKAAVPAPQEDAAVGKPSGFVEDDPR